MLGRELLSQGLEVPDAVGRLPASPHLICTSPGMGTRREARKLSPNPSVRRHSHIIKKPR